MGQKIHPKCFRLGVTEEHLSHWFGNKSMYSSLLYEDFLIRETLVKIFKKIKNKDGKIIRLSKILIDRHEKNNFIVLYIFCHDGEVYEIFYGKEEENIKLKQQIEKELFKILAINNQKKRNFCFKIQLVNETKSFYKDANLIAFRIVENLENRAPFKRAVKNEIEGCKKFQDIKGIKIQVSGRLNGVEIARSEWRRHGRIPLHTLKTKIDYSYHTASTKYGIIGVKVWLFFGEVTKKY